MDESFNAKAPRQPSRPRWRRRLAILAVLLLAAWVFRASLLQGLAAGLIVDDRPIALRQGDVQQRPADAVLLLDGDRQFDSAAELYCAGATTILIYSGRPGRLVRLGILEPAVDTARRELAKRGVSRRDLDVLVGESGNRSTIAAALGQWLSEHPDQTVSVLCDRFTSRTWKIALQRAVEPPFVRQISIVPLPDRQFDETNWWRCKPGMMALVCGYIRLGFHWCRSGSEVDRDERTPDEFRAAIAGGSGR